MTAVLADDQSPGEGGVKSVMTALELLESFTGSEELGISEMARRLGVAKSTAHRLITTLCSRGFVERNPRTGRYRLGLQMYELGMLAVDRMSLRRAAMPMLEELRERTRGTVQLAVPDGPDAVYLIRSPGARGLQQFMPVGMRLPAHTTSCGLVMAAFDPVLAQARREAGFPTLTKRTLNCSAAFDKELRTVAQRGYALSIDTVVIGMSSVGAAIFDRNGMVRAALSMADVTPQIKPNVDKIARLVTQAAQVISRRVLA